MATRPQTVIEYLRVTEKMDTIDRTNLQQIRSQYATALTEDDDFDNALLVVANLLNVTTTAEDLKYFKISVNSATLDEACKELVDEFGKQLVPRQSAVKIQQRTTTESQPIVSLSRMSCQILVKQNRKEIIDFIGDFLLDEFDKYGTNVIRRDLRSTSVLFAFIRHQLEDRVITTGPGDLVYKFPLVPHINMEDKFGPWHFDHLHDLFELNLIPEDNHFPRRWTLASNTTLFYTIEATNDVLRPNDASRNNYQTKQNFSVCELLATLHKIKLYFHHILGDKLTAINDFTPAMLDNRCVDGVFDEMQQAGFADDGLFGQMKNFFLPLTVTKKDLLINDNQLKSIRREYEKSLDRANKSKENLQQQYEKAHSDYWHHVDRIKELEQEVPNTKDTKEMIRNQQKQMATKVKEIEDLVEQLKRQTNIQAQTADLLRPENINNMKQINPDLIKMNRGFIMYGPPGTGKSQIMSKLSTHTGITMVASQLAAGELNRPLVGESEQIILHICERARHIPYLICCISIDEIDSLTSKRQNDTSEGSAARLGIFLSIIDGNKNIPNLMIFCATNRIHSMDEAFLRRMQGKFFVGRPSAAARRSILGRMSTVHLPPSLLEYSVMVTTNFSGAAMRDLASSMTVHCVNPGNTQSNCQLDYPTVLRFAHKAAYENRILIGGETIPSLLLKAKDKEPLLADRKYRLENLSSGPNSICTGKILINFHLRRIDIEKRSVTNPKTHASEKTVITEDLLPNETDTHELIERLAFYGIFRNVQLSQLIDLNLFASQSAHDERSGFEVLKQFFDESSAYRRSLIAYDLDSLVGVSKNEGGSATNRTTSSETINKNMYTFIKDKFRSAYVQSTADTKETIEQWSIMIIRDQYLLRQFYGDTQFTRPEAELKQEEEDAKSAKRQMKCVQCNDFYIEEDNRMGACVHHDGFVYNVYDSELKALSPHDAVEKLIKEDVGSTQTSAKHQFTPEQKEKIDRQKQRFRFICCNQILSALRMAGGCKRGTHNSKVTKREWSNICISNSEYKSQLAKLKKGH
ncbi:unnamed protein product [Adineta ricciae]|uniref:AAA+ ATPase domain-containing protein n=1 Tax=Adineta ricciae TaxID=249248 RepID=A0A815FXS4_ADIRI|nr:unnamed protein product [Adineta ricciae]CAF1331277.1 unnamed protein product [Adineta ricciae]